MAGSHLSHLQDGFIALRRALPVFKEVCTSPLFPHRGLGQILQLAGPQDLSPRSPPPFLCFHPSCQLPAPISSRSSFLLLSISEETQLQNRKQHWLAYLKPCAHVADTPGLARLSNRTAREEGCGGDWGQQTALRHELGVFAEESLYQE